MANMTAANFYAYVLKVYKRTDKSTEVYEAITDVIRDMKERFFFAAFQEEDATLQIGALGDYTISLPTDTGHLIGSVTLLDGNSSRVLVKISKQEFDIRYPNPTASNVSTAKPQDCCVYGDTIYLGHVPDSADYYYKISHSSKDATAITSVTTEVPFTEYNQHIVRYFVLAELFEDLGISDRADRYMAKAERGMSTMVASEKYNTKSVKFQKYRDI